MARAKKDDKTAFPVVNEKRLKDLMKSKRLAGQNVAEINGNIGQAIREASEKHHLHKGAFGWICRLDRLEPEKLRDWLDHFEYMLDASGLRGRSEAVMKMPGMDANQASEKKDGDEEDDGVSDANVAKFPAAAGNA